MEVPGLPGPPPPQRKPHQQHGSPGSPRQPKSKWSTRRLSGRIWQTWLRSPRVTLAFDKSLEVQSSIRKTSLSLCALWFYLFTTQSMMMLAAVHHHCKRYILQNLSLPVAGHAIKRQTFSLPSTQPSYRTHIRLSPTHQNLVDLSSIHHSEELASV